MIVASILQPLEDAVQWVLKQWHTWGLTWAWAIVATTIVVRILLLPLTVKMIHSMQAMQRHQPALKEIQKRNKGDRKAAGEEQMAFFKEHGINPYASCLPLVAQFPVFISLYLTLKHFTRYVKPTDDLSWLHIIPNITAPAAQGWGYLLLVIYAASQVLSTYFMATTADKTQRYVMMALPLFFIFLIAHFPVGLVIYWLTTNLWNVGQGVITRRLVPKVQPVPVGGPKKSSRTPPKGENGASAPAVADTPTPAPPRQSKATTTPRRVKKKKPGRQ